MFDIIALPKQNDADPREIKEPASFSMDIKNVELTHECCSQHFRTRTASMK